MYLYYKQKNGVSATLSIESFIQMGSKFAFAIPSSEGDGDIIVLDVFDCDDFEIFFD